MIETIFLIIIGALILTFSAAVILSRKPIYAVFWLILTFLATSPLFLAFAASFVAFILIIVYIGAVAILFLFVVMFLNPRNFKAGEGGSQADRLGFSRLALIALVLMVIEGGLAVYFYQNKPAVEGMAATESVAHATLTGSERPAADEGARVPNIERLGNVLYTQYFLIFQVVGLILLVGIIGAITLTLRKREHVRRQKISKQTDVDASKIIRWVE